MRPIRVLHVIDSLGRGGAERCLWDLVRLSDPDVVRHRVVTYYPADESFVFAERLRQAGAYRSRPRRRFRDRAIPRMLYEAMPAAGKRVLWPAQADFDRIQLHATAWARIARACAGFRPHVLHGHVFHGVRVGARVKPFSRCRVVYTVPSLPAQLREAGADWVLDDYRRWHHAVDAFFVDPEYRAELEQFGVPRAKMHGFLGAVDVERVAETAARSAWHRHEVRDRIGIPADAPAALSVGRLTPSKGHRYALAAMRLLSDRMPSLHWIVVGEGEERRQLEEAAAAAGLAARTHLVGYVEDPRPFYAAADLYLRTPILEGENTSSHDAMAFGLPVVGFDTGCGTDRIAVAGHGVLVPNRDAGALASGMASILERPDRGRALGARGAAYAREHLDIRTTVSIVTQAYRNLVGGSHDDSRIGSHPEERARVRAARLPIAAAGGNERDGSPARTLALAPLRSSAPCEAACDAVVRDRRAAQPGRPQLRRRVRDGRPDRLSDAVQDLLCRRQ